MSQPPPGPPAHFPPALRRLLRGILFFALLILVSYGVLIAAWVLLNPRW